LRSLPACSFNVRFQSPFFADFEWTVDSLSECSGPRSGDCSQPPGHLSVLFAPAAWLFLFVPFSPSMEVGIFLMSPPVRYSSLRRPVGWPGIRPRPSRRRRSFRFSHTFTVMPLLFLETEPDSSFLGFSTPAFFGLFPSFFEIPKVPLFVSPPSDNRNPCRPVHGSDMELELIFRPSTFFASVISVTYSPVCRPRGFACCSYPPLAFLPFFSPPPGGSKIGVTLLLSC